MDMHLLWYVIAGALILLGLAGTILPALPGLPLVFAGMLLAAWVDGFRLISAWTVGLLAVLTLVSIVVDIAATALGTLVGAFFSIPGLILGPFLGAMIAELLRGRELAHASRIGFGTWIGLAIGTALKLALAFAMLGIFVLALLF